MTRNDKLNHMLALTEEINVLTQRIKPIELDYTNLKPELEIDYGREI